MMSAHHYSKEHVFSSYAEEMQSHPAVAVQCAPLMEEPTVSVIHDIRRSLETG
jgi:hypothetical protein